MATNPKYPVEPQPRPGPRLVHTYPTEPPRSFKLLVGVVALAILAAVILVALWMIGYGGGSQHQPAKPANNGTPSGLSSPELPRL